MPHPICRHIKTNGLQCGSPSLEHQLYCFYHHRLHTRHTPYRRVPTAPALIPGQHLQLSALEDRDAIQVNISVVINALATGQLETKRAMAILYGLQLASSNVARMELPPSPMRVVRHAESTPDGLDLAAPGAVYDPSEPHLFNHMDDVDPSDLDLEEETERWQSDGLIRFTTGTQEDAGERAQSPRRFEYEEFDDLEEPQLLLDPPSSPLPGVNCHQTAQEPTQMSTLLEQLRSMTTVVADSGDINSIQKYKPQDSTTNPSLIAAAAAQPEYQSIVDDVLKTAKQDAGSGASDKDVAALAFKTLAVAFGRKILDIVPGRVSTEVDARLSYDTEKTIEQAKDIIGQYDKAGISRERVLIKIASTWEGIQAAEQLEKQGIHCNLTLLFGLHQAIACAEAKVTLISPFVGRILDWYKKDTGKDYTGADDPGVQSVTTIYNYYKKFDYKTVVMGASFRNIGEITELAGCDLLTIAPKLLEELSKTEADLPRKLDPAKSKSMDIQKIPMDKATFDKMHAEDRMAHDKLKEGIEGFSKALEDLEKLLEKRLAELDK